MIDLDYSDTSEDYDSNSYENLYAQHRTNDGGYKRNPVHQPTQQNYGRGFGNDRYHENSNGKRGTEEERKLNGPNQEYYDRWEKNIKFEESAQTNEKVNGVFVNKAHSAREGDYSIIFLRTFAKQQEVTQFIKTVKKLSQAPRVRCVAQSKSNGECPIYQGNIIEVKPDLKNSPGKCDVTVEFSSESYRDIMLYLENVSPGWRIEEDKLAFYQQMRENLEKLKESPEDEAIFIQKEEPQRTQFLNNNTQRFYMQYAGNNTELNEDQKIAIKDCLTTNNYNLVVGMPGTGKTQVIAVLLKILISIGKKVLVTAYTHSAIDNMLKRFVKEFSGDREQVVRFGNQNSIDQDLADLAYSKPSMDVREEDDILASKMIFAVTCLGISNKALEDIIFDFCIVDEASQIVEPTLIGPLLRSKCFVLFGDHYQMPPLVKSQEAKDGGMDTSFFEKLAVAHKQSISYLTIQYRMNENIMKFSNTVVYSNRMRCANEKVRTGKIPLGTIRSNISWIPNVLSPTKNVIFLDLGRVMALHKENKNLNCLLSCFVARQLLAQGMRAENIGIITPLRDDHQIVNESFQDLGQLKRYTIDTCQGIDKSCIIMNISLNTNRIRPLLSKLRRVNVAFTRAQHKLIIIGSFHDLKDMEGIGSFVRQLDRVRDREIFDLKMLQEAKIVD